MKRFGIVSYNIYGNFTNYGSALQSWALYQVINKLGKGKWEAVLVDYCPDSLKDKDPLNPFKSMWDRDEESLHMCELSMPAIRKNYRKFVDFYKYHFNRTIYKYTSKNFNQVIKNEDLDGFVCGSDTIFCVDEFGGFDDGYFANYECMKKKSVAYAASFGDTRIEENEYEILNSRLKNFKAIGLREEKMIPYTRTQVKVPVKRTIDPTILINFEEYQFITKERIENDPYLLLYARRYDPEMEKYAERLAKQNNWKIVEISLRATNAGKGHQMLYEAGVEEFLSLVKYADYVVTNSYHGLMFSVLFRKNFAVFSRESGNSKISEAIDLFGLNENLLTRCIEKQAVVNDYDRVYQRIEKARYSSLEFLKEELTMLEKGD